VTSNETITLMKPAAGTYRVCVAGFAPYQGNATYTLNAWVMGAQDQAGNFKVSVPGSVFMGANNAAAASWSGLAAVQRYLGMAEYLIDGSTVAGRTIVEVDATDPLPVATIERAPRARVATEK
jgi:hypothetical protein